MQDANKSRAQLARELEELRNQVTQLKQSCQQSADAGSENLSSNELQRALFEGSADPIVITDLNDIVLHSNPAVERVFGYAQSDLAGKPFPIPEGLDSDKFEQWAGHCRAGSGVSCYDTYRHHKDGTKISVSITISPIKNAAGDLVALSFFYRNITARAEAIAELEQSKNFLNNVIDALDDPVFVKDEQHRWVVLNTSLCQLMGHPRRELIGKSDYDVFPREQADVFWARDEVVLSTGIMDVNEEDITWHGELHHISTKKSLFIDSATGNRFIAASIRDLTDQKRAQQALKESEERYRTLFESAPLGITLSTLDGTILAANDAVTRISGYSTRELISSSVSELYENAEGRRAVMAQFRRDGFVRNHEVAMRHKNGSTYYVRTTVTPCTVQGEDAILSMGEDITRDRQAEEANRYRVAFERLIAPISSRFINLRFDEIDNEINKALEVIGRFVGVDRSYVFQFREDGMAMDNTHEWCANGIEPQIKNLQGLALDSLLVIGDKLRNGERAYIPRVDDLPEDQVLLRDHLQEQSIKSLLAVPMIFEGKAVGALGFDMVRKTEHWPTNITSLLTIVGEVFTSALQRKRTEEALRRSEERFRTLAASAPVAIMQSDAEGNCVYANRRWSEMTGIPQDEAPGTPWYSVIHEDDRDKLIALMENPTDPHAGYSAECRYVTLDGKVTWVYGNVTPMHNAAGDLIGYLGTASDITERRQAEETLRASERAHQHELMRVDRLRTVGRLAAGVAHEINNPLSVLYGTLQELSLHPPKRKDYDKTKFERLLRVAGRIKKTVHNLLVFSRQQIAEKAPHEINAVIENTLSLIASMLAKHDISLELLLDKTLPKTTVNAEQMQQVFLNLILNAHDAMPEGGSLTITTSQVKKRLHITFADTGCGIDQPDIEKIFTPFFTTKDVGSGTGLGLSISYGIIRDHGGDITAANRPGGGAEFVISLPLG